MALMLTAGSGEAYAAKGSGGGHRTPSPSGTFALVLLNSTDGQPHWGQQVTFTVSATTSEPHVNVDCSQNSTVVYGTTTGYYASYPWPWTQVMTLSSADWAGGDADCTAVLWYASGTRMVTLATLRFHVYP